jgi:CRISPR/Cas system CSM-associated protein Csm3 (group 7 of RAMP superfamily)
MFATEHYAGILTALSPIHQGGDENTGNTSTIKRIAYIVDGRKTMVPIISGNSIRGQLRRLIMADILERIGHRTENLKIYNTLFSGGTLESTESESGYLNLGLRKKIRDVIPPLSLLGTAIGNQMVEGKIKVGIAVPICTELSEYFAPDITPTRTMYDLIDHDFSTRRDDIHAEREEGERAIQMKVDWEIIVPGTQFAHRFSLVDANPIERSAFGHMIALWQDRPYLGGKSGIGYGKVKIEYTDIPDPSAYRQWLVENGKAVTDQLVELEGEFR